MPFVNLPDFVAKQILAASSLDQIVAALNSFSAQSADISWPLTAGDNLDMDDQWTITGMRNLWKIVNAGEYGTDATALQAAIDAVEGAGGGVVLLPPYTTFKVNTGLTVQNNSVVVMGFGESSIVELTTGSGPIFTCSGGSDGIQFLNFRLFDSGGSSADGIKLQENDRVRIENMDFSSITGDAINITNSGADGDSCIGVKITNCRFRSVAGSDIVADDVQNLQISGCESTSAGAGSIILEASGTNALLQDIQISDCVIDNPTGKGVSILGFADPATANWSKISVTNVSVDSASGDSFELGAASKQIKDVRCQNCDATNAGADGLNINADGGIVDGFYCQDPATNSNGLDTTGSENLVVGTVNVRGASGTGANFVKDVVHKGGFVAVDSTTHQLATSTTGDVGVSITIPANTVSIGDVVRVIAHAEWAVGSTPDVGYRLELAGQNAGGVTSITSSGEAESIHTIHIDGLTGANTYSRAAFISEITNAGGSTDVTPTVDWTADVEITFNVTANGTADGTFELHGVTVELLGGV